MEKKGQAAMEFLMTYGWAILAAIIVIGVLAIYFRPSSIAPDAFIMEGPPFTAGSAQASAATGVTLELTNNAGANLNVTQVVLDVTAPTASVCTDTVEAGTWVPGVKKSIVITDADCTVALGISEGDQLRGTLSIDYYESGSTLKQVGTGSITYTAIA